MWCCVSFFGSGGKLILVLLTYLVYNTVVRLCQFFCCCQKANLVQIFLLNPNFLLVHRDKVFVTVYLFLTLHLGWKCRDLCLLAPPPKRQRFLSVADMSRMSARHVSDILLCRPIFWLSVLCQGIFLYTHFPIRKQESVLVRYILLHPGI